MNFTTMTTFAPRIWGFDASDYDIRMACAGGWSPADLMWEWLTESALRDWAAGEQVRASWGFRRAHLVARLCFSKNDLRRATGHANLYVVTGKGRHRRMALVIWRGAAARIAAMRIAPRARSSLFHLRMEARHRDTYHGNLRLRVGRIAAETEETFHRLPEPGGAGHRHFSRWRGEKPNVYDDTRKILGACLLLIDRPVAGGTGKH